MSTKTQKQTATLLTQAATKVSKEITALAKIAGDLTALNDVVEETTAKIELKEAEIAKLEVTFSEKEREMTADLALSMKENAESVVNNVLQNQGKVAIDAKELDELRDELNSSKVNFDKTVQAETNKAIALMSARHQTELTTQSLTHKTETAQVTADLKNAKDKIQSLEAQITDYKQQITSEREARVKIAQASQEAVVINQGK
jgi:chromosome segregation ATPase